MSQYVKARNSTRPIGNPSRSNDPYARLPPVQAVKPEYSIAEGMIVSSMAVPPQKLANCASTRKSSINDGKPRSGDHQEAAHRRAIEEWERSVKEKERLIREKDKQLRDKTSAIKNRDQEISSLNSEKASTETRIAKLESECKQLKDNVSRKEEDIKKLQTTIDTLKKSDVDYKALYEKEKAIHEKTSDSLTSTDAMLKEKVTELSDLETTHSQAILTLQKKMEGELAVALKVKDDEIKEKDERIQKMKKQMAETFMGNSTERQQQIDELTKELTKMQSECDNLKSRLRQGGGNHKGACESCRNLKAHLEKKDQTIKEKVRTLDEMTLVCGRYETQLKEQEKLMKQWKDVEGRVLIFDK